MDFQHSHVIHSEQTLDRCYVRSSYKGFDLFIFYIYTNICVFADKNNACSISGIYLLGFRHIKSHIFLKIPWNGYSRDTTEVPGKIN